MASNSQKANTLPVPNIPARLLGVANRISRVMEQVRLNACSGEPPIAPLWYMDTLHDLRRDIYTIRILARNTMRPK